MIRIPLETQLLYSFVVVKILSISVAEWEVIRVGLLIIGINEWEWRRSRNSPVLRCLK